MACYPPGSQPAVVTPNPSWPCWAHSQHAACQARVSFSGSRTRSISLISQVPVCQALAYACKVPWPVAARGLGRTCQHGAQRDNGAGAHANMLPRQLLQRDWYSARGPLARAHHATFRQAAQARECMLHTFLGALAAEAPAGRWPRNPRSSPVAAAAAVLTADLTSCGLPPPRLAAGDDRRSHRGAGIARGLPH